MAVILSKEDLIRTASVPATPLGSPISKSNLDKASDILDKVNLVLNNQLVQNIIGKVLAKYGLGQAQNNPSAILNNPSPSQSPEIIYGKIVSTINGILSVAGDLPLSQVKDYMINNKEQVVKMIANAT